MSFFAVLLVTILALLTLTRQETRSPENLQGAVRDFRSFEGNKLDIEENNITVISCNCSNLDFHLVLKNGHVKRYISRNKTHGCYTYEIVSTSEKMQVVHNEEVVATAEDDLKKMVLKCTSKYASWKILKTCWNALESHPCRIDCPYRHCRECKDNSGLDVADHNTPASSPGHKSVIKNETHTQNSCDSPNLILYTMLIILAILMALAMIYLCWKYVKYRVETREKKEEKYFTSFTLTFEKIDTQDKLLDPGRDIRFFKGELIDIKENNIIVIICNCPTVNFHLILKNGYVKRYTFRSKTRACYTYEIGSTSEKTQVVRSGEVVTTAEDGLETMVLKCSSKYASWKILKNPARDFRFFEGNKLDIEGNNITVISCNCTNLDFHLVLKNGHVKRYISRNKTHGCYTYEIVSTSEKTQVVHNGEVVKTAEDDLKKMVLKCSSKYASWKILKMHDPVKRAISNYTQAVSKKPKMKTSSSWSSSKPNRQHCDIPWEPVKLNKSGGAASSESPAAEKQKRMRRQETTSREQSYREAAASHLRVAVVDVQHPLGKLTADQVKIVQKGLMGALDRQLDQCLASDRQAATFRGIKYTGEILRITCEDELSLKWLQKTVRSLTPLWEGAQLNVVPLAELPRLNQWDHVKKWLLFHREAKSEAAFPGNLFVFGLGMDEAKIIREREGKINYMLSSFNLKLKENEASAQEGQTPMEEVETPGDEASTKMALQQINFIQINLQHCRMATTVLCRRLDKMQNTIAIIQESWIVKSRIAGLSNLNGTVVSGTTMESPRTCIYIPRKIKAVLLPQVSSRDVTAVNVKYMETKTYRNPRLTNWALYNEELDGRLGTFVQSIPTEYRSTEDIEKILSIINDSLMSAYEKS
ncbi:hypothetical protein Zmor_018585 [Zophobas morio]|uniref:DUF4780 domain-containing protein n=1 Tax=Zophobas morio TaxID=2755281 RepID=A0AA38IAT9_9CUCU|nr:hypothetical protein Zmor_018585 [Zophobas morio]